MCRYCGTTLTLGGSSAASSGATGQEPGALILEDIGRQKIGVIKVVCTHTGLGLKEAKELAERAPCVVADWSDPARMVAFARALVEVGARVGEPYAGLARR